jgi:serine/threonine-protein kinase
METGVLFAGRYTIEREIGRGSFGIVYLADDAQSGGRVAIKVLSPEANASEQLRHRLRREAKLAQELKGPHAIRVHEVGESDDGQLYMAMEFLKGRELTDVLRERGRLPPDEAATVARQVLDALGEAHRLGIIHRDLKPHNIFLCPRAGGEEFVKVLDFGIAKVAGTSTGGGLKETAKLTMAAGVLGTPVYMSPEQCRGEALTPASDLYSLGIVLYEALTGKVPFDHDNPVRVMMMHDEAPPPPLPGGLSATPIGQAVMRALHKRPAERFASAEEFAAALAGGSIPPPAADKPRTAFSAAPAMPPAADAPSAAPPAASGGWSKYVIGGLIVLLLVLVVIMQFF